MKTSIRFRKGGVPVLLVTLALMNGTLELRLRNVGRSGRIFE